MILCIVIGEEDICRRCRTETGGTGHDWGEWCDQDGRHFRCDFEAEGCSVTVEEEMAFFKLGT